MRCEGFGCKEIAPNGDMVVGCDTIYAVDREHFGKNWIEIKNKKELTDIIELYQAPQKVDVVLTGGEPLLHVNDVVFLEFLEYLVKNGHRVTFETNATIWIDFEKYPIYKECVFALSVKLSNSNESFSKRVAPKVLHSIAANAKDAFFKFSIDKDSIDIALEDEIEHILSFAPHLQVYCMPVGGTKEMVEQNTEPLIEFCKTKGYNFSDRLHIRIWDANKGV